MKILMADVGGTNVKLMATGHEGRRKVASGPKLTATRMVKEVLEETSDWNYDAVSIGYPSLVCNGLPTREPLNLGNGWVNFDFEKAFGKPVRFINDAAMQALASYEHGRMLFVGFGTSIGASVIVDDVIIPIEVGLMRLGDGKAFMERVSAAALKENGVKKWNRAALEAITILQDVFKPDDTVLGGGNAKEIEEVPKNCRRRDNQAAFIGASRLWAGSDMIAEPYGTSWRIKRPRKSTPEK